MAVIRVKKNSNYTVMSNYHFKEKQMSLKAKGLLSLMLSLPPDWDYSINGLVAICKESKDTIKATLKELKTFGYLKIEKIYPDKTESGRLEYEYIIFEKPQESKKQGVEKQGIEKQEMEKQALENQSQLNKKELNTKELNTKESNTKKKVKSRSKKSESYDEILKSLNNKDLEDAFKEFINMRNEMKKPLTPYALELAIKELFRLSKNQEEMVAIVNQSIQNSWLGLFPLRKSNTTSFEQSKQNFNNEFLSLLNEGGF